MLSLFILIKYISISTKGKFYIAQLLTLRLKPKRIVTNGIPTLIMPWVASKYSWCCLLTDAGDHALPRCRVNLISKDVFFGRSLLTKKRREIIHHQQKPSCVRCCLSNWILMISPADHDMHREKEGGVPSSIPSRSLQIFVYDFFPSWFSLATDSESES